MFYRGVDPTPSPRGEEGSELNLSEWYSTRSLISLEICRIQSCFCPIKVLEHLCPSKTSQTIRLSKAILLAGGKIAQIGA
jgi:hypothetical protein